MIPIQFRNLNGIFLLKIKKERKKTPVHTDTQIPVQDAYTNLTHTCPNFKPASIGIWP